MNFHAGSVSALAPAQAAVAATSTAVVAENSQRVGMVLMNLSSGTIYIGINNAAVVGSGITLLPNGGVWTMDEYNFIKEPINAIAHSAGSLLAIQEFVVRS